MKRSRYSFDLDEGCVLKSKDRIEAGRGSLKSAIAGFYRQKSSIFTNYDGKKRFAMRVGKKRKMEGGDRE